MKIIIMLLILIGLNMVAFGQEILYDGMAEYKTAVIKPDVQAIFERDVFPKAREHFKKDVNCQDSIKIMDGAAISVSEGNSEKVYLYDFSCSELGNFPQGFAIIENGEVTKHYAFNNQNVRYDHIFYKNGLVVLAGKGFNDSDEFHIITTLDTSDFNSKITDNTQDTFVTYESCQDKKCKTTAKKIYFQYGDGYFFWIEGYQLQGSQWVKTIARKSIYEGDKHRLDNITKLK